MPKDAAGLAARRAAVCDSFTRHYSASATRFRAELGKRYGAQRGQGVKYAEAFEVCEYGRMPNADELAKLFPF